MTDHTYQPTGAGLCAECGQDVGRHDAGHHHVGVVHGRCRRCGEHARSTVHDVGRVLRCPEVQ